MRLIIIGLLAFIIFISGCGQTAEDSSPVAINSISIEGFAFEPDTIIVDSGTEVIWINNHEVVHTIVSQGLFESEVLNRGDEFRFTFSEPGEYDYYCGIHPSMRGKVIVR